MSGSGRIVEGTCDVCVVTYNSADSIHRLLESLRNEPPSTRIRLLDNASTDDTCRIVENAGSPVELRRSERNLGFPAACNRLAQSSGAEIVALVNPDIEFQPDALPRLIETVRNDHSIGVATCRLMTRGGSAQAEAAREQPRLLRLIAGSAPRWLVALMRRRQPGRGLGQLSEDRDVECPSGALMVMRRELFEEVGYLDESVFMYLEDIDFAARVRRAGYRVRYLGTTWVWHDSGVSARGRESELFSLLPQVWLTYLCRYGDLRQRFAARPVLLAVAAIAIGQRLTRRETPRGELRALWLALTYRPTAEPVW
jgi:N-acetylglucosaminyl-diphospho-decaprenol L-rhamnosyltransferase